MKRFHSILPIALLSFVSCTLYADANNQNFEKLSQQIQSLQQLHAKDLSELESRVNENVSNLQKTMTANEAKISQQISTLNQKTQDDFKEQLSKIETQLQQLESQINELKSKVNS